MTALENVCLPALLAGRAYHAVLSRARELLDWLGLGDCLNHQPRQLLGGEMQRCAIARALSNDPAIVLADEPTGNLDLRNARKVMALLSDLNRQFDRTVVIATHSGARYPVEWQVAVVPLDLELIVRANLDDQEMRTPNSTNCVTVGLTSLHA